MTSACQPIACCAQRQLEWLELYAVALEEAHVAVRPQLPHLTSLVMGSLQIPQPAVLRCGVLRELNVDNPLNPPPRTSRPAACRS